MAHGGTLFLDEIENMPLSMQAKLLLVLSDQRVQRLGGNRWTRVNMRVIAASNVPLRTLVAQGKMRSDFYYRIHVIPVRLLPLRQRAQDIPLLVQDFLHHHPVALQKRITGISPTAIDHLMQHHLARQCARVAKRTGESRHPNEIPYLECGRSGFGADRLNDGAGGQQQKILGTFHESMDSGTGKSISHS